MIRRLLLVCSLAAPCSLQSQTQLLIISGVGGDPQYVQSFASLSTSLAQAAHDRGGVPDSAIAWYGEAAAAKSKWYRGASTKENVERAIAALAQHKTVNEQVVIVLIGHGSGEGADTRISLPGPDITAAQFSSLVTQLTPRPVAFVNLTSASGDMLPVLMAKNRVVLTATRSAFERNESHFARFFVDAFAKDGADTDKDGRVSLLEAYTYAQAEVKRFYEVDGRLATEHSQIADNDQLARRFFLVGRGSARASDDPKLASLYADRFSLDEKIQELKKKKATMTADAYDDALEQLLLELARKAREIRQLERGS